MDKKSLKNFRDNFEGTFGEAWLVISRASGKNYVMKEMCTGGWEEKEKDLSMNEVNILASCNHVNIVRHGLKHFTFEIYSDIFRLLIMLDSVLQCVQKRRS